MDLIPVVGASALLARGSLQVLVVADLHLGLEHELLRGGITIPSQTGLLLDRMLDLVEEVGADRLVVVGDLKQGVPYTSWQERREIPAFLARLTEQVRVDVVMGNHDVGLSDIASDAIVHPPTGMVLDGVGYFHGHTWPSPDVLRASHLVAAHIHPAVRLLDPLGHGASEPVWLLGRISPSFQGEDGGITAGSILVLPAFNPLCGGYLLNAGKDEERGPIMRMIDLGNSSIYLLDGTSLGTVGHILAAQDRAPRRRPRLPRTGR
ncbi:MAG: Calcineurin-like phosphoesterase [Methanosaeta sp. PtaB.Bin039]|nr:MAG: Calcineurin-like phosphoesterase [Methanosaeta sp. PtaB.Bin039]